MSVRIVELSISIILGVALWWCWEPSVTSLRWGLGAYALLLSVCRKSNKTRAVIWTLCFLFGSLRVSTMPNVTDENDQYNQYTTGWVVHSNRREALIENETERWKIKFYPEAPTQGSLVAVWHQPQFGLEQWSGGVDQKQRQQSARFTFRRAKEWVLLSEPKRLTKPLVLHDLSNGDILWALLSGDKSDIPLNVKQTMQRTGTSHLLAISGMHIGLVAAFTYMLIHWFFGWALLIERMNQYNWGRWNHRMGLIGAMSMAICYGYQVGWPASAQRAVLMVCIFCIGKWLELSFSIWDVLGLTALLMVLWEPSILQDLGFQLSFSAVIGIGLFGQRAYHWTSKSQVRIVRWISTSMGMTIGATLGTLPICAWVFQAIPLTGLVANLIATPLLATLAVPLSMMGLFFEMGTLNTLSVWCFVWADACVELGLWLLEPCEWNPFVVAFDRLDLCIAMILIVLIAHCKGWLAMLSFSMCLVGQICWNSPYFEREDQPYRKGTDLSVTFLPVGQGDATLLEWSDGEVWLIDGGPFTFEMVPYLQRRGIWKIDKVWLSHPHADHMDGIFPVLNQLTVGSLIVGRELESSDQGGRYSALWELAKEKHIPIQLAEAVKEDHSVVNRGVRILHPHDWTVRTSDRCNEESVVLEITHQQHRILFLGDIEEDAEKELLKSVRSVDLLKVAHHGSRSSSSPKLMNVLNPTISVITVGEGNRFGHPHAETLWVLRDSTVLRTDWHGMITVDFRDGKMIVQ